MKIINKRYSKVGFNYLGVGEVLTTDDNREIYYIKVSDNKVFNLIENVLMDIHTGVEVYKVDAELIIK